MERQVESAAKRGRGYWFIDGFTEMAAGGLLVLLGGVILLRGVVPQAPLLTQFAATGVDVAIVKAVGFLAAILAIWWLKDRFTFPRTGYVREKWVPLAQIIAFIRNVFLIIVLPLLGLVAAFFILPGGRGALFSIPVWLPVFLGMLWGVLCYWLGEWTGLRRFRLLGMLILLAGVAVGGGQLLAGLPTFPPQALTSNPWNALPEVLRVPLEEDVKRTFVGLGLLTLISGAAFVLSGLATFLRYRKENPSPYREEP
ncbi:MAG: hypothetical protein ABSB61_12255 [Anaerolineales bacterium]|jgi:hypothetical protein